MGLLTPQERDVLKMRHFEDVPEAEVAEILEMSTRRVREIAASALAKLRDAAGVKSEARN
jgi:RNA polymerase sigma factor (sigma-70 family)